MSGKTNSFNSVFSCWGEKNINLIVKMILRGKWQKSRTDFKLLAPPRCHVEGGGWGGGARKAFKTWELLFPSVFSNLPSSENVPPFFLCPLTSPNPHRSISQLSPPPLHSLPSSAKDQTALIDRH